VDGGIRLTENRAVARIKWVDLRRGGGEAALRGETASCAGTRGGDGSKLTQMCEVDVNNVIGNQTKTDILHGKCTKC
jgi:hypothetical protein